MSERPIDGQPLLPPERPGAGACCEAQPDGTPCAEGGTDCIWCGRARPESCPEVLEGLMMSDGLYPLP